MKYSRKHCHRQSLGDRRVPCPAKWSDGKTPKAVGQLADKARFPELPEDIHDVLDKRTDPTRPTTWFVPRTGGKKPFKDDYSVMANWGANHGAISYGHIGADLITFASILRIPVCMHNVPEDTIFRPGAWNSFGSDPEGADYRACETYEPIYK